MTEPKYPEICVPLSEEDGNAFFIINRARKIARRSGVSTAELDKFSKEAMSSDYDHVLQTVMRWFATS